MYFKQNNTLQQTEMQKQIKTRTVFKSDLTFKAINGNILLAKIFKVVIFHTKHFFC